MDSDISVFALLLENGGELLYAGGRTEAAELGMLCRTSSMIACFVMYTARSWPRHFSTRPGIRLVEEILTQASTHNRSRA
ncbi:hypothetical protein EMIT0324P_100145 [Pseudomonas chlororaphis]